IRAGGEPSSVIRKYTASREGRHKSAEVAVGAFLRGLQRGLNDIEGRLEKAFVTLTDQDAALLERTETAIQALRDRAEESRLAREKAEQERAAVIEEFASEASGASDSVSGQ